MCSCASCKYTDEFTDKGFAEWPRGNPAGKRSSEAAYREHVAHSKRGGIDRAIPAFTVGGPAVFHERGTTSPIPEPSALVRDWIARSYAWRDALMPAWQPTNVSAMPKPRRSGLADLAQKYRAAA